MKKALLFTLFVFAFFCKSFAYRFSEVAPSGQTLYYNIVNGHAEVVRPGTGGSYQNYVTGDLIIPATVSYDGTTYAVTALAGFGEIWGTFYDCDGLTSVVIPNSVTTIGHHAFSSCSGLTSVTIHNSVNTIGNYAFSGCTGLTSIIIPNSVASIGNYAFGGCTSLSSVTIPNTLYSIGNDAFSNVRHIEYHGYATGAPWGAISMNGVTEGDFVFSDATKHLLAAYLGDGGNVMIPSTVDTIGEKSFYLCVGMISITIPNSVTSVGDYAFGGCSGLTNLFIPNSVISIGNYSFSGCNGLSSVAIPNSVTSIGSGAFYYVRHIEYYGNATGAPWGAISLNGVTEGDFVFSDATKHYLVAYSGVGGDVMIPSTVDSIGDNAFYRCTGLSSITIPNSVTCIGNYAFYGCSGLTSVIIPNSVITIGDGAFSSCSGLNGTLTIPNSVTSIGTYAFVNCSGLTNVNFNATNCTYMSSSLYPLFYRCSNLTTINIGDNVTTIPSYAFYGCNNLTAIWMRPTTPPTLVDTFSLGANSVPIIVPRNSYNAYLNAGDNYTNHPIFCDSVLATVLVNDTLRGTVTSDTIVECFDTVSIFATANYGYHFTQWNDGDTCNPRVIILTHDTAFTALFSKNHYSMALSVDSSIHGSVTGAGIYEYLNSCSIYAISNYGYHFTQWNDGDTNNPRIVSVIQDTTFTAFFAKNTYSVTAISSDTAQGFVTGSTTAAYLDTVSVFATANYGYHFSRWSDGDTNNPRYVTLTHDIILTALFAKNFYVAVVLSENETMGYVSGGDTVEYLDSVSLSATSNYGYHFSSWNDGDINNPRVVCITQDTTFTALFAKNQYTLTVQSNNNTHGSVSDGGVFDYLDTATIIATSSDHYHFVRWDDGNTDNPRKYVIVGDATLTAIFAIDTHTVSVTTNDIARGMVEATGSEFSYGTPCTVTATAYTGYVFTRWSNGITANPYTFAVLENTELMAIFDEEGTQGIDDVTNPNNIMVSSLYDRILIDGLNGQDVTIYTIEGRTIASMPSATGHIAIPVTNTGVYIVKVGEHPARKVVVIR